VYTGRSLIYESLAELITDHMETQK
jgi:hypothetical protein